MRNVCLCRETELPGSLRFTEITKRVLAGFLARYDPRVGANAARERSLPSKIPASTGSLSARLFGNEASSSKHERCVRYSHVRVYMKIIWLLPSFQLRAMAASRERSARTPSIALSYRAFVGGSGGTARISRDVRRISEKYCIPLPIVYDFRYASAISPLRAHARNSQN